jgi:hypothetical protein
MERVYRRPNVEIRYPTNQDQRDPGFKNRLQMRQGERRGPHNEVERIPFVPSGRLNNRQELPRGPIKEERGGYQGFGGRKDNAGQRNFPRDENQRREMEMPNGYREERMP